MRYEISARRLRAALDRTGMKAQNLANTSGIGKSSISQYLSGEHAPSYRNAEVMAGVLGVSPVWLMGFDVPMTNALADDAISNYERTLIAAYRDTEPDVQRVICRLLNIPAV